MLGILGERILTSTHKIKQVKPQPCWRLEHQQGFYQKLFNAGPFTFFQNKKE